MPTSPPAVDAPVQCSRQGRVGDVVRRVCGIAVEVGDGHGAAAAVPADELDDRVPGMDVGHGGVEPARGCSFGRAIDEVLQGYDVFDEGGIFRGRRAGGSRWRPPRPAYGS